jgi:uncharacterized protein YrzB (UPF0473 family)
MNEQEFDTEFYTLTDEDGNEIEFEVLATAEIDGVTYYAMAPAESDDDSDVLEYVLLKVITDESGEDMFETVVDADEEEKVAQYFDELFDSEVDYDA